jgi:hypothetical protein
LTLGLLNFPKSFDDAGGILVGIVVQASLIVFIVAALLILGKKIFKYHIYIYIYIHTYIYIYILALLNTNGSGLNIW